jgi:hypothetical protein
MRGVGKWECALRMERIPAPPGNSVLELLPVSTITRQLVLNVPRYKNLASPFSNSSPKDSTRLIAIRAANMQAWHPMSSQLSCLTADNFTLQLI